MSDSPSILAARKVLLENYIKTDIHTDEMYIYNDGCYYSGILARNILKEKLHFALGIKSSPYQYKSALFIIHASTLCDIKFNRNYISLENGFLSLETGSKMNHHRGIILRNKFPITYNHGAPYKDWSANVLNLVGDDESYANTLQEFVGYTFKNGQIAKKLLFTYGPKNTGKTTFYEILLSLFGRENCSELELSQLTQPFLIHNLRFRVANIRADIDYNLPLKGGNKLKSLVGGDTMSVDKKFVPDVLEMRNNAKIYLSGNGVPNIKVDSELYNDDAFCDRWLPIPFTTTFELDFEFMKGFTTKKAKSAILNWALIGLKRLRENKWIFSYNPNTEEIREWFGTKRRPFTKTERTINDFVKDICDISFLWTVSTDELYSGYEKWSISKGYPPMSKSVFNRKLNKMDVVTLHEKDDGKFWKGIRISTPG